MSNTWTGWGETFFGKDNGPCGLKNGGRSGDFRFEISDFKLARSAFAEGMGDGRTGDEVGDEG
jgi:hypothetical protein